MNELFPLLWPPASSFAVAVVVSLITSHLAARRWRQERAASVREEAYKDLTRAAYRWVRTLRDSTVKELSGSPADIAAIDDAHDQLNDTMFMLSKVASPESFRKIDQAHEEMVAAALAVDLTDPALKTTGTKAGAEAQLAMKHFVNVVSDEMRTHLSL